LDKVIDSALVYVTPVTIGRVS